MPGVKKFVVLVLILSAGVDSLNWAMEIRGPSMMGPTPGSDKTLFRNH